MLPKKIIGILAGMGPKSTSPFLNLVIDECQKQYGAKDDIDFPHIIIYSLPTPFYVTKKIDDAVMESAICQGLQKLEKAGVDFIAMPCNSAHKYYPALLKSIHVPLLHIVDATVKRLPAHAKKVTLFATNTTIDSELYQHALRGNVEIVLREEWQADIDELIQGAKNGASVEKQESIVQRLAKGLRNEGVDTVIVACTDIVSVTKTIGDFTIIDSSKALAEATIEEYLRA